MMLALMYPECTGTFPEWSLLALLRGGDQTGIVTVPMVDSMAKCSSPECIPIADSQQILVNLP
ncbi:hypothetical protein LINGRAHAP2_LOCUS2234, partial [Linum grandiflorum]